MPPSLPAATNPQSAVHAGRPRVRARGLVLTLALPLVFAALPLLASGCASLSQSRSEAQSEPRESPGPTAMQPPQTNGDDLGTDLVFERAATQLLPAKALPSDLFMQQRIEIEWEGRSEGFDAAVQKRGDVLTLMGLGPFSTRAFTLVLEADGRVRFEQHIDRPLPFAPSHILADVQRVFYPWFEVPATCDACERSTRLDRLLVSEQYAGGRLHERRFRLLDHPERGEIVIRYRGHGEPLANVPREATVENGWFGYRLRVETTRARALD